MMTIEVYKKIFLLFLINPYYGVTSLLQQSPLSNNMIAKQWKLLEYDFDINLPINDKNFYNSQNIVATGIAVSNDRIFIATPRLFSGVAATVSTVPKNQFDKSPKLQAFPNWSFHTASLKQYNCSDLGLVSVYRLRIDSCNRLWALDAGVSRSLEDYEITCPPKILIFDLNTNQVVRRIDFPKEVIRGETLFTNLIIDETTSKPGGNCDDVFVYISDTVEPAIVVYDSGNDLTWRVSHPSMYPDPDFAQSEIDGQKFVLMDGIVGLAFDERTGIIYFQPLATERLFSITKDILRAGPLSNNEVLPVKLVGKKSSQGIGLTVSPFDSSIIFSPMTETAVASWNPNSNKQTIIAYDPVSLQFVADMSLSTSEPNSFYCISSRFHRYFLKNLNTNEYNIRITKMNLPTNLVLNPTDVQSRIQYNQNPLVQPQQKQSILPPVGAISPLSSSSIATSNVNTNFNNHHNHNNHHHHHQFNIPSITSNSLLDRKTNQYFFGIDQPYQYEPVGLINRGLINPFTALNQGEEFPTKKLPSIRFLNTSPLSSSSSSGIGSELNIDDGGDTDKGISTISKVPSSGTISEIEMSKGPSSSLSVTGLNHNNNYHHHHHHHQQYHHHPHHLHHQLSTIIPAIPQSPPRPQSVPSPAYHHENYLRSIPATTYFNFNNNKIRLPKNVNETQVY